MIDPEDADNWRYFMAQDLPETMYDLDLRGCDDSFCTSSIKAWASALSRSPTLAAAEARVAKTKVQLGGEYRDLLHLLTTETQAALLAVERRHFENSFTTC